MPRFSWAAWGLLVVVLDLPLPGTNWDVLPDLVGYVWIIIGLAGGAAMHPGFVRARAAVVAGIPASLVTGTPLFLDQDAILFAGLFIEILVTVTLLHQLATAIRDLDPVQGDSDHRRWASGIRVAAPIAGVVELVGLVLARAQLPVYFLGFVAMSVIGIIAVVLMHRVNRAGWLGVPDADDGTDASDTPGPAATANP